jgi:hypothetical protein
MEERETSVPSLWFLVVSLQAYHLCFLTTIHGGLRTCGTDWFGRFCDNKKCVKH